MKSVEEFQQVWQQAKTYKCPYCGSEDTVYDSSKVLTSNPPQHECKCNSCKKGFYSGQCRTEWTNRDALDDMWKQDQSILNTPKIEDPLPGESPYWIPFTPDPFRLNPPYKQDNYGWICPKCGRVMAPFVDSCKFCNGGNTLTVTTPNTLNDYLSKNLNDHSTSITAIPNPNNKLTNDSDLLNYITTAQSIDNAVKGINTTQINNNYDGMSKEEVRQKFLNESESVFEAVDKYKEWEKSLGGNK